MRTIGGGFAAMPVYPILMVWLVLWLHGSPARSQDEPDLRAPRTVTLSGTVLTLDEALKERSITADPEPSGRQIVLKSDRSAIIPVLSNGASRALYLDERLRGRPAELKGLLHEGLPYLDVLNIRVMEQGMLRTPEYYCDVCTITTRYPQACPCCQGPMELRYDPAP
jgi:hypothetical protein